MSEQTNVWGLRLLALALASLSWFIVSGEKREAQTEKVIEATVRYGRPEGFLLLDRVEHVRVVVRGGESRLRNLNPFQVDVFVELPNEQGLVPIPLGPSEVILPEGLEVVSIEPNVINVRLDQETTAIVSVRPSLEGEPAAGAVVVQSRAIPNRAQLRGPASRLRDVDEVGTTPIDLAGHALDFEEEALVLPPDFSITVVDPSSVRVVVDLEIPTSEEDQEE